jgi:hypothetical protein
MTEALQKEKQEIKVSDVERVLITGNLKDLKPEDRVRYYAELCRTVGVDPLLQPFKYTIFDGMLQLYATKNCTDQLIKNHQISITFINERDVKGCFVVTAQAQFPSGRVSQQVGAVSLGQLSGKQLENGIMRTYTKAARRAVLQGTGLTMPDESELSSIPNAVRVEVDEHGEIISQEHQPKGQKQLPETSTGQTQDQTQGHESAGSVIKDLDSLHSAHKLLNASFPAKPEKDGRRDDGSTFHTVVQLKKYREEMRQSLITAVMLNVEGDEIDPDISVKDLCKLAEEIAFVADTATSDDAELAAVGDEMNGKKPAPPTNPFSKKTGAK